MMAAIVRASVLVAALFQCLVQAQEAEQPNLGDMVVEWDYCSIPHSQQVYDEAHDYIYEVFNGYNVPINPRTCPFFQHNLDYFRESQRLQQYKRAKNVAGQKQNCTICKKQFKSSEYLEFHLKTQHPYQSMDRHWNYMYGSQDVSDDAIHLR
jgi:hypothetical protein